MITITIRTESEEELETILKLLAGASEEGSLEESLMVSFTETED